MALTLGVSNILLGVGAAHLSSRPAWPSAVLEWIGGLALITGLAAFGVALAQY